MVKNHVLLIAISATVLWPSHASAQIYMWKDASGNYVLSDQKINAPTDVYMVEGAPAYRTTTPQRTVSPPVVRERYDALVAEHASRLSLRPELVRAVIQVESGFDPFARSPKGAMGLMQLMPATARELGVRNAYDPEENIRAGTRYLRQLLDRYDGDERLALAAYNAGAGAVDRYGRQVPRYKETQDYVRKVGAAAGTRGALASLAKPAQIVYKTIDILDGRAVPRYSTVRPAAGTFEILRP